MFELAVVVVVVLIGMALTELHTRRVTRAAPIVVGPTRVLELGPTGVLVIESERPLSPHHVRQMREQILAIMPELGGERVMVLDQMTVRVLHRQVPRDPVTPERRG